MKSLKFILLIIILVSCTKKTQTTNSHNDSVEKYLKLASIDTLPFETRKAYNQKAFSFIDLEKNDSTVRWYLSEITFNNILNDSASYYKVSKIYFQKANEINDTLNLARYYRHRGNFHRIITKMIDSSFFYYIKSENLYKKINDKEGLARIYINKSIIQNEISDYEGAEYSIVRSYNYFKRTNRYRQLFSCYNSLGNINHNLAKYKEAIEFHKKGLKIVDKFHQTDEFYKGSSLNNIGNAYRELKDYKNAIYYFKTALSYKKELKRDVILEALLYDNLGHCYLKQNNFKDLPYLFDRASKLFDSLGVKNEGAISKLYLSEYYTKTKDTTKAIQYAEEAMKLAKESKATYYYLCTLTNAGEVNKKKASIYIKEYHRLNDSLLFEERKARNQFFKIQLETDEITQEKEKAIKQKWVQTSIIAAVLLIVILLFIIFKQRAQKKEFVLIQNQQKASEEIYQLMLNQQSKEEEAKQKEKKRIALELHDNVMNKLASTRFNLFTLTQKSDNKTIENAVQHIDKIKDIEDEIRNITHELSKETFSKSNSFTSLLTQLIEQHNQIHPTDFNLELDPTINWDAISSEIKMNLYRIIQEAIHNTNKYAQATKAAVSLLQDENKLCLSITDNGIGFDTKAIKQGIGIQNMQQRIASIGGEISIITEPGNGTVINCSVIV
jgi:signal transduction histidine kinase